MSTYPLKIPDDVLALCRQLRAHGYETWVVGGCLRDMLLGRSVSDWDLATSARPEQVMQVFRKVLPTGIEHGTVTVRFRGQSYELTTLRGEGAYSDGRHPDSVHFVDDIEADLARRDFTFNAIAYAPFEQTLIDPFGGLKDLEARRLRAVGNPRERFEEDGLRVLRAARFVASLEVDLDPETEAAIRPSLSTFQRVSGERVRDEWMKALRAARPSRAFDVMRRTGILRLTLGTLADVFDDDKTFAAACEAVDSAGSATGRVARLAGFLHPVAAELDAVDGFLRRYRYSNAERAEVARLLRALGRELDPADLDQSLRRFASAVGREHALECLAFRASIAACAAGAEAPDALQAAAALSRAPAALGAEVALSVRELAVSGKQLLQAGVPPGPEIGRLLTELLDEVLADPARNQEGLLLARVVELRRE